MSITNGLTSLESRGLVSGEYVLPYMVRRVSNLNIADVGNEVPTPLGEIGVDSDQSLKFEVYRRPTTDVVEVEGKKVQAKTVALIVLIVIAVILMIYMYLEVFVDQVVATAEELFSNFEEISRRTRNTGNWQTDNKVLAGLTPLDLMFGLSLIIWSVILLYEAYFIQSQFEIYLLLGNIILLISAIVSIVYYNNAIMMLILGLGAIILLLMWERKLSFYVLIFAEILILIVYGLKFSNH